MSRVIYQVRLASMACCSAHLLWLYEAGQIFLLFQQISHRNETLKFYLLLRSRCLLSYSCSFHGQSFVIFDVSEVNWNIKQG